MSVSTLASPRTTLRWEQALPHGSLLFELTSSDAKVLEHAEHVFRPYLAPELTDPTPFLSFHVEPQTPSHPEDDGACAWTLHATPHIVALKEVSTSYPTLDKVLANVEFAAVHAAAEYASVAAQNRVVGLHGALLHRNGRGVLIIGVHEAGKSTLACSLWQAGWSLSSDDYVLLDPQTSLLDSASGARPSAFAMSRRVSLRPTSRALLGEDLWERVQATPACDRLGDDKVGRLLFHPHEVDGVPRRASVPLHAIVLLQRPDVPLASGEARLLDAAQALFALLPHCGLLHRTEIGPAMRAFGPIVGRVSSFDLRRGPLPTMIASLDRVLDTL